ncbi:tetratricopeptide repeat protein [Haloferula chungangensis]|uniref:Tetratricopeptide repeat protein n=1 Tax=Haloferula chungangensis TaxID=1048331 RepID=A0ABW2L4M5_9BACT
MDAETARQVMAVQGYTELGLFDVALEELGLIDQDLDIANILRCDLFSRQSRWAEMGELAKRLARSDPDSPQWWISWAYAVRRLETIDAAREILIEARKSHPKEPIIIYNLACYASVSGELEEARQLLDQAIALDKTCQEMAVKDSDLEALFRD